MSKPGESPRMPVATSSGDMQKLETGKEATVNLLKVDGEFTVMSVLYTNFSNLPNTPIGSPAARR